LAGGNVETDHPFWQADTTYINFNKILIFWAEKC